MKIHISNFRGYQDRSFEFPDQTISLLTGPSGSGKSTIFQAIYWCLYGSLRNIYHIDKSSKKCKIECQFNQFIIIRETSPSSLFFSDGVNKYSDKDAQVKINEYFGDKEIWHITSYIEQQERCHFLLLTNDKKMEFLNKLSFNHNEGQIFIDKIENQIKTFEHYRDKTGVEYNFLIEQYNKDFALRPWDENMYNLDISVLEKDLRQCQEVIKQLDQLEKQQQRNKGKIHYLESNIKRYQSEKQPDMSKISVLKENIEQKKKDRDIIQNIESEYQKYQVWTKWKSLYEQYNNLPNDIDNLTINDVNQLMGYIKRWKQEEIICRRWNIPHQEDVIKNFIRNGMKTIQDNIMYKKQWSLYMQFKKINAQIDELTSDLFDMDQLKSEKNNLIKRNNQIEDSRNLLKCPHCSNYVKRVNNELIPGDSTLIGTQDEFNQNRKRIIEIDNEINKHQRLNELVQKKNWIQQNLGTDEDNKKLEQWAQTTINIDLINEQIQQLGRIQHFETPKYDEHQLKIINTKLVIEQQLLSFSSYNFKIEDYVNPPDFSLLSNTSVQQIDKQIRKHEKECQQIHNLYDNWERGQKELSKLIIEHEEITKLIDPELETKLKSHKDNYGEINSNIEKYKYAQQMNQRCQNINNIYQNLQQCQNELNTLEKLRHNAVEVECQCLQDTVNVINNYLNILLPVIFDNSITVNLQLFKQTKHRLKHSVNFNIIYRGIEYEGINNLSGGEGDRISLALSIALNHVSGSPFLLLDECFSSLDERYRSSCLEAIRNFFPHGKTIIFINHEDSSNYDYVVKIE